LIIQILIFTFGGINKMKKFGIIGVGGYIAPRHLKAINDTNNKLVVALDKNDSVGILDKYFKDVDFFTEFERFDRHCEKIKNTKNKLDFITVCSPNYLHDAHVRFGLRIGANVICEKPLVLNSWNLKHLSKLEKQSKGKVYTVLQLRYHPTILELKKKIDKEYIDKKYDIELSYITPRGNWYDVSWKGDEEKSGGVATNIGVHFFDMLLWIFGKVEKFELYYKDKKNRTMCGYLELEKAKVKWFLSVDKNNLPVQNNKPYRSITINGKELEFSDGFTELHTEVYKNIMNGKGYGIKDAEQSIKLVGKLRNYSTVLPKRRREHYLFRKLKGVF
jgi:UDP-N-acetyl-2-amino-2-deoxyglucuronate dehydrogenase